MIEDKLYSEFGKRIFFPKGIAFQAGQAAEKADKINATVGLSRVNGKPMHINNTYSMINGLTEDQVFSYAPNAGNKTLRELWKQDIIVKNPSLTNKELSLPIVTGGLTQGLSLIADMFVDKDDTILIGQPCWGNYNLIFGVRRQATVIGYDVFDLEDLKRNIPKTGPLRILVNFPNNPTGWSPDNVWAHKFSDILKNVAEEGRPVLAIFDDAYFGLNYSDNIFPESLFSLLAGLHENILAIKCDGATKEYLMWGFRVGFVTFDRQNPLLESKVTGALRCSVSSCSQLSQSLLVKTMEDRENTDRDKNRVLEIMKTRYNIVKDSLKNRDNSLISPLPFNSGYFMTFRVTGGESEQLRKYLLEKYGCGVICFDDYLRLAYCSLDEEKISPAVDLIYQAAGELWN